MVLQALGDLWVFSSEVTEDVSDRDMGKHLKDEDVYMRPKRNQMTTSGRNPVALRQTVTNS